MTCAVASTFPIGRRPTTRTESIDAVFFKFSSLSAPAICAPIGELRLAIEFLSLVVSQLATERPQNWPRLAGSSMSMFLLRRHFTRILPGGTRSSAAIQLTDSVDDKSLGIAHEKLNLRNQVSAALH